MCIHSFHSTFQTRLGQVFAVQAKLKEEEVEAYFSDFIGGVGRAKTVGELLLSHTRVVDDFYMLK